MEDNLTLSTNRRRLMKVAAAALGGTAFVGEAAAHDLEIEFEGCETVWIVVNDPDEFGVLEEKIHVYDAHKDERETVHVELTPENTESKDGYDKPVFTYSVSGGDAILAVETGDGRLFMNPNDCPSGRELPAGGFAIEQGDECIPVKAFTGEDSVEEFYNWDEAETQYSSAGQARDLQQDNTSVLFLYRQEGSDDVYLVLIHGRLDDDNGDGGSISMEFENLSDDGSWVVQDDFYDEPSNFDRWQVDEEPQEVDWTWAGGRTDGGVFGPLGDDAEFTIVPAFNEEAALYGEYYDGMVDNWKVLSGSLDDPSAATLDVDEPIRIRAGTCDGSGGNGDADEKDDADGEKKYSRDEIAQAKYGEDFDELSVDTTGEVQELYNRQPFADGREPDEVYTRDELAQKHHGRDFDEIGRWKRIEIQDVFDEQFGDLPSDPKYSADEIAQAKYGKEYEYLSEETSSKIREIRNRQPFADGRKPDEMYIRDEIAQKRYDADFDELGRAKRIAVQNAFDAQFEATADAA
jgi:hypothetical protein